MTQRLEKADGFCIRIVEETSTTREARDVRADLNEVVQSIARLEKEKTTLLEQLAFIEANGITERPFEP